MRVRGVVWCISSLLLAGCPDAELAPIDPCTISSTDQSVALKPIDKVDVLFVIDDSGSMEAEQERLKQQLPPMVKSLATGHLDDDGVQDFPAVRDLHLGVVSSNMGTFNATQDSACGQPDDGQLLASPERCAAITGGVPFIAFAPEDTGDLATQAEALGAQFGCLAELGTAGCGQEQQLEAALKALTPSTSPLRFARDSVGHGDGVNAGFLREDSVVAVIVVTDEDDCSHPEASAFLTDRSTGVNIRCGMNPEASHPAERFVQGLRALRPGREKNVIFGAIVGIPIAASGQPPAQILALPEMTFSTMHSEDTGGDVPAHVCSNEVSEDDNEGASAALRIVEVARLFGEQSYVHSICAGDYRPALDGILTKIGEQLDDACVPRPLQRTDGSVPCDVRETLQPGRQCDPSRGRERIEIADGQEVCLVKQLPVLESAPPQGAGWYYDDFSDEANQLCRSTLRIAFSPGAEPDGVSLSFECLQPVRNNEESARGKAAIGNPCPEVGCESLNDPADPASNLFCAALTQTCQQGCTVDDDCPSAWRCHAPTDSQGQPLEPRCVNPRCGG